MKACLVKTVYNCYILYATARNHGVTLIQFLCLLLVVVKRLTDEWTRQEMETFTRCLIESNKDFILVAKQVAITCNSIHTC